MRLHPLRNKRKLIMCPHPLTATWQLTYFHSLKNYVLAFLAVSSLVPIMIEGLLLH